MEKAADSRPVRPGRSTWPSPTGRSVGVLGDRDEPAAAPAGEPAQETAAAQSAATNTGDQSAATVKGKESIAMATGIKGKAKGERSSWLVLAEWEERKDGWHIKDVKSVAVDGKKIKEDTFYTLKGGKFVEVE